MKKYSVYIWLLIALSFMGFIGLMSYWYPVTLDEYYRWKKPWNMFVIKRAYFTLVPSISALFSVPIFIMGKWSFILLNSVIQFVNALFLFYILFVRIPNIKDFKDMPYFIIILCMSVYFVCSPSEVMFWISGAVRYSWTAFFLLLFLCFVRQIQTQKLIFKDNRLTGIFLFLLGFIIGTSNESLSPIMLLFIVCFSLFFNFKKIKAPKVLSYMIFGVAIGCLFFFSAPAHYYRIANVSATDLVSVTLGDKLFFHLYHLNKLFQAQFFLPVLSALFLVIAALDKSKRNFRSENFWYSIFFGITGLLMALILFIVPRAPLRSYYAASLMNILSFLFLVKYYITQYNFDFSKILCYIVVFVSLIFTPRFVIPHYVLHLQEETRQYLDFEHKDKTDVVPYFVLKGPTGNLSIGFMDYANQQLQWHETHVSWFVKSTSCEDW